MTPFDLFLKDVAENFSQVKVRYKKSEALVVMKSKINLIGEHYFQKSNQFKTPGRKKISESRKHLNPGLNPDTQFQHII